MTNKRKASVTSLRAPVGVASVQGSLALDLAPRFDPPAPALVPSMPSQDVVEVDDSERSRVDSFIGRYLRAAVEIVAGDRPSSQVARHTQPEVYADLRRRALLIARAGGHTPGQGRTVEVIRPQLMSARTSFVSHDAVEACMLVRYGARCRAVAARFELQRERWICVALEFA
ncbi:Rv3235 family protein [Nocardioides sp. InS609-2]|uniref:Rv3235 family protein n=1 Tax=Nocardioides sp. InS609-2 TaxID=2760705 RepID=UPI0020C073D9|nr:Rv3235 family protein [Nocardioides sp. InS609-2]